MLHEPHSVAEMVRDLRIKRQAMRAYATRARELDTLAVQLQASGAADSHRVHRRWAYIARTAATAELDDTPPTGVYVDPDEIAATLAEVRHIIRSHA